MKDTTARALLDTIPGMSVHILNRPGFENRELWERALFTAWKENPRDVFTLTGHEPRAWQLYRQWEREPAKI